MDLNPSTTPSPLTYVLHVDDDEDQRLTTKMLLDGPGVEVIPARSAEAALEQLREREFALALVDVNMPGVGGFELAERMRREEGARDVPIIFITGSSADPVQAFRGYKTGAIDFLLKPVHPVVLESKVEAFVSLYRQRQELREQKDYFERLLRRN